MISLDLYTLRGRNVVKRREVIIRTSTAHQVDGSVIRAMPVLSRPSEKDASGTKSSLRITDWFLDLSFLWNISNKWVLFLSGVNVP